MNLQAIIDHHAKDGYAYIREYRGSNYTGWDVEYEEDEQPGVKRRTLGSGACHAGLRSSGFTAGLTPLVMITGGNPELRDHEGVIKFYHWLLNQSVFSEWFVVKDAALSISNGFVLSTDIPRGMALPALQLSRLVSSELKQALKALGKIVEYGTRLPMEALIFFVLGFSLYEADDMLYPTRVSSLQSGAIIAGNHLPFNSNFSLTALRQIMSGKPVIREVDMVSVKQERTIRSPHSTNLLFETNDGSPSFAGSAISYDLNAALRTGTPTIFTKPVETVTTTYESPWAEAAEKFLAAVITPKETAGPTALNWFSFEERLLEWSQHNA